MPIGEKIVLQKIRRLRAQKKDTTESVLEVANTSSESNSLIPDVVASTQALMDACLSCDLTQINANLEGANVLLPILGFGELLPLNVLELKAVKCASSEETIDAYEATLYKLTQKTLGDLTIKVNETIEEHQYLSLAKTCNALILSMQKEVSSCASQAKKKLMNQQKSKQYSLNSHDSVHFLFGKSISRIQLALSQAERPEYLGLKFEQ